jgi:hypothetical protein
MKQLFILRNRHRVIDIKKKKHFFEKKYLNGQKNLITDLAKDSHKIYLFNYFI